MFKKSISLLLFFFLFTGSIFSQEKKTSSAISYTPEQEYLFKIFKSRRSVRNFKATPIPKEHILKIIEIASSAPTSGNQQPWKFLVIQDSVKINLLKETSVNSSLERMKKNGMTNPEKLKSARERLDKMNAGYLSAPLFVVVLTDTNSRYPSYNEKDGSLAAGYLMIAARALGYGTVFTTDSFPPEMVQEVFDIPGNFKQICFVPIGVPEEWPDPPAKKPVENIITFENFVLGENYELPVQRKTIKLSPKIFDTFLGKYEFSPEFSLVVSREKDNFYAQATGQPKVEIFPETETNFFLKVVDAQIIFEKDENGKVTGLMLHQGGRDMTATKVK
jgi:nitroreductase